MTITWKVWDIGKPTAHAPLRTGTAETREDALALIRSAVGDAERKRFHESQLEEGFIEVPANFDDAVVPDTLPDEWETASD